jgi:peptidoglycan hydrolase-like protein with peptidoglycan-binding domain
MRWLLLSLEAKLQRTIWSALFREAAMALKSRLFAGEPKLEAAAVSDPAHIKKGAIGDHVRRIQVALRSLDGATIDADGTFGPATDAAVLAFKQKRDIVNHSYQSQADSIVGKMTMTALDKEMVEFEKGIRIETEGSLCQLGKTRVLNFPT